ncbi:CHAT domain-containing protein [Vacuolonema iberomarrocanum]|uniref:CHAT domain-containing protein n=1 Tax=Vacuolonema iberomarrocanum TaxID=3454632 RepID=UPI0019DC6D22|nr:CHAT domain-containing protein [filamentous cyanobacterium LEGE 07170]
MSPIQVLILTANPRTHSHPSLQLDSEVRRIEEAFQRSRYRDRFQIITKLAVRTSDLRRALLDHRPHIVQFSGHGTGEHGLFLEDDTGEAQLVGTDALASLFGSFEASRVECVLLNACYSEMQATAIHQFVDCVIGMNQPIGDKVAVQFSEGFYDALGAGSDYEEAYKIGCSAIALEGSSEFSTPVLKHRQRRDTALSRTQRGGQPSQPDPASNVAAAPTERSPQSQSIGNITISGSNNPFNAIQAMGDVDVDQSHSHTQVTDPSSRAALETIKELKQAIVATDAMDDTEKEMIAIPIRKLEAELQKSQPDQKMVEKAAATLTKMLDGVPHLTETATKLAMFTTNP